MQPTSQLHDHIIIAFLGIPEYVLDDAATLDSRYDMFDHYAYP